MSRRLLVGTAAVVACSVLVAALLHGTRQHAGVAGEPTAAVAAPAEDAHITQWLGRDRAFRNDIVFLVVATLRDRCQPDQRGLLARMANRAGLPVLAAVDQVTTQAPALDAPLYRFIQNLADHTGCDQPLLLPQPDTDPMRIDPATYTAVFPDSYDEPQRERAPVDHAGQGLAARAANACNSVVYAVLPLDQGGWQCAALRSAARAQVREACEQDAARHGRRPTDELQTTAAGSMLAGVTAAMQRLPEACR